MSEPAPATVVTRRVSCSQPIRNYREAVRRFDRTRLRLVESRTVTVSKRKKHVLVADKTHEALHKHGEENGCRSIRVNTGLAYSSAAVALQTVVEQHPPFRDCMYSRDDGDNNNGPICCVSDRDARQEFINDGWTPFNITHLSGMPEQMPTRAIDRRAAQHSLVPPEQVPGPSELSLPDRYPPNGLWGPPGVFATQVEAIGHAMEVKSCCNDKCVACSPLCLWTDEIRTGRLARRAWPASHINWLEVHWVVDTSDEYSSMSYSDVTVDMGVLLQKAGASRKGLHAGEDGRLPSWSALSSHVANRRRRHEAQVTL